MSYKLLARQEDWLKWESNHRESHLLHSSPKEKKEQIEDYELLRISPAPSRWFLLNF